MIAYPKPHPISFRELVPAISDTGYATHGLYFHPAKFIPHVVRYCLDEFVPTSGCVFDPFAGSGTTGLEAVITGRDAYLADLNPLLDVFLPIKIPQFTLQAWYDIYAQTEKHLKHLKGTHCPPFVMDELPYWYPQPVFEHFSQIWGQFHTIEKSLAQKILAIALFKTSKKFSHAEHNMPKLFTSKTKRAWLDGLLAQSGEIDDFIWHDLSKELSAIYGQVAGLLQQYPQRGRVVAYGGVDSATYHFDTLPMVDAVITSPPYLQAQEYIRTFKLELWWAGWSAEAVRQLASLEIPFRPPHAPLTLHYIEGIRHTIQDPKRQRLLHAYFEFMLATLDNACRHLKTGGYLCVFVGNPQMEQTTIEIWKAIYEHFVQRQGFRLVALLEDPIKTRKLFGGRNNPNPDGMKSEYMLVLQKP